MLQDNPSFIFDFNNKKSTADWYVVNDGVMGGLSQGEMAISDTGNGLFKGYVSTKNNGGFSSIRHEFDTKQVSQYDNILLKVRGDGKKYQFRIKENSAQRHSYTATFETSGKWETIKLPFTSFYPRFRGNALDIPNFAGQEMEEIAIFIGNKKNEAFALEIESIALE